MKEKLKKIFKSDSATYCFAGFFMFLAIFTILIATITFPKHNNYTLNFPGNTLFGTIVYSVVIIMALIYYFVLAKGSKKNFKIENIFLSIVIPLGIMYCFANPLGKIPDEDHHARKAFAISQGNFFSKADEETGQAKEKINAKVHELVTRSTQNYEDAWARLTAAETEEKIDMSYTTMALYSPLCHAPQALGIFVTRLFGATIVVQCYAARLTNMAVAICLLYFAIKLIPFKKHIIAFLALLPLTLNEIASMSSDALCISMSIFYISYIIYLKYSKEKTKITTKDLVILTISSIVVALNKIVYLPLCLLVFILPKEKFETKKIKLVSTIGIFILAVVLNLVWLVYCSRFLITFNPGVDSPAQVKYILVNPIRYFFILFRTMNVYNQTFIMSLCGEGLGSYNAQASVLYVFPTLVLFAGLFFINDDVNRESFDLVTKLVMAFIFVCIVGLIYTSLYVQWTPYATQIIMGVQARYFLPILPLTMIILDNKFLTLNKKIENKYLFAYMLFFNLNAISCIVFSYMYCLIEYYVK